MKSVVCATLLAISMAGSASALVVNGNFDVTTGNVPGTGLNNGNTLAGMIGQTGRNSWDRFAQLEGWTTTSGSGIEVQTNKTLGAIDAHSGEFYIELDSNNNSSMTQTLNLRPGQYQLTFFYAPRRKNDVGTNGIAWDVAGVTGDITGPSNAAPFKTWTEVNQTFFIGTHATNTLTFSAIGTSDSLGGFIDSVSIAAVPVPASILGLGFAIAGLGALGRRKRA
ncbi:MAG: VPLPA-CTERM sorting domain-containing protein [Pseudomonadota bacterium]